MSNWNDYYEPSEFDEAVEEFKDAIRRNVRQELQDVIEQIKKENAELREVKENWDKIKREHEQAMWELTLAKEHAKEEVYKERLVEFLRRFSFVGYRPDADFVYEAKCDKCDEYRKIHFVSPMGREMVEDCSCAKGKLVYNPKEVHLFSFTVCGRNSEILYFERFDEDINHDRYEYVSEFYDNLPGKFDEVNQYRDVFKNKADCAEYCKWLTEKGGRKR